MNIYPACVCVRVCIIFQKFKSSFHIFIILRMRYITAPLGREQFCGRSVRARFVENERELLRLRKRVSEAESEG